MNMKDYYQEISILCSPDGSVRTYVNVRELETTDHANSRRPPSTGRSFPEYEQEDEHEITGRMKTTGFADHGTEWRDRE